MSMDPDWTPLFRSLPEFDSDKCIAIGDLLSQTTGPGSLAYSADFREAAARRIANLPPLKKDAKAQVAPRRGLLMTRAKLWTHLRRQGVRSQFDIELDAVNAYWQDQLAASQEGQTTSA